MVAPAPRTVVPVQTPDTQVAVGAAVDGSPEEHVLALPLFRDELGVSQQVVQDIGVEHWLGRQLLAELVALDALAVHLVRREVKLDLGQIQFELTALFMILHSFPTLRKEGVGVAVNHWPDSHSPTEGLPNELKQIFPSGQRSQFTGCESEPNSRILEFKSSPHARIRFVNPGCGCLTPGRRLPQDLEVVRGHAQPVEKLDGCVKFRMWHSDQISHGGISFHCFCSILFKMSHTASGLPDTSGFAIADKGRINQPLSAKANLVN